MTRGRRIAAAAALALCSATHAADAVLERAAQALGIEHVDSLQYQANGTYYQFTRAPVWQRPHTLNPDRLARDWKSPHFETFNDKLLLTDAARPIELHVIRGSGHNDAFAMAWLPGQKLLVEADAWTPTPPGAKPPPRVNPLWINLYENILRLDLAVERVMPLHGTVQDIATLRAVIGVNLQPL